MPKNSFYNYILYASTWMKVCNEKQYYSVGNLIRGYGIALIIYAFKIIECLHLILYI